MATNAENRPGPIVWVLNDLDLANLIEATRTAAEVIIDLETTGLDEHAYSGGLSNGGVAARVVLASLTLPQDDGSGHWNGATPTTYVLPLSHPDSPFSGVWRATFKRLVAEGIVETKRPLDNQNMKFDARWIYATTGIDVSALIMWDTVVSSHLMDETRSTRLKVRVPEDFDIEAWNDFALDTPGAAERVPLFELGDYAARDTWWTWRLKQSHAAEMFIDGGGYPEPLYGNVPESAEDYQTARFGPLAQWVAMPSVASVTRIEQNGFRLDIPWTRQRLGEELVRRERGLDAMAAKYGQPRDRASSHSTALWFKAFTDNAVQARELEILSTTRNLNPQWNKAVLKKLSRRGMTVADMILDARGGAKLAEFLTSWLGSVSRDGKIHANYNVGRVSTGRLSSNNPNMQQITKSLRPAFIPSPGYVLADFDFSQLELRMAAFVARCQPMIDAFNDGQDLHRLLGSYIVSNRNKKTNARAGEIGRRLEHSLPVSEAEARFHHAWGPLPEDVPPEDVSDEERQGAKSANFGLLYMQTAYGFRNYAETVYGVLLTEEEAIDFYNAFFERWAGMREWHEETQRKVARDGYITSPLGRVRRLPNAHSSNEYLREESYRQAVNSPIQGTGSDLMMMAAADIQGILPGTYAVPDIRVVATVHDSVVVELPEDNWEAPALEIKRRMEESPKWFKKLGVDFDVPIVADFSVGTRWSWDDVSDPEGFAKRHPEFTIAAA